MAPCRGGTAKRGAAHPPPHCAHRRWGPAHVSLPPLPQQTQAASPKELDPDVDPGVGEADGQRSPRAASGRPVPHPGAGAWAAGQEPAQEDGRSLDGARLELGFPSSEQEVPLVENLCSKAIPRRQHLDLRAFLAPLPMSSVGSQEVCPSDPTASRGSLCPWGLLSDTRLCSPPFLTGPHAGR